MIGMKMGITEQLRERFEVIKNVRMTSFLQATISTIFKKQSSFDNHVPLYTETVRGYLKLFPDSVDQLCLDLKMRIRDATRCKVNLALLRYATETNCRWLSKIGVTPANYMKSTQVSTESIFGSATGAVGKEDGAG